MSYFSTYYGTDDCNSKAKGSYTGVDMFCKSQLITCNRVKECNGVCPFEDALKHADKMQTMNEQHIVDHDRDWIIGCLQHDGFIHTHRFDKANQIILEALQNEQMWIPFKKRPLTDEEREEYPDWAYIFDCPLPDDEEEILLSNGKYVWTDTFINDGECYLDGGDDIDDGMAWMHLPKPYKGGDTK